MRAIRMDSKNGEKFCWMSSDDIWDQELVLPTSQNGGGFLMIWACISSVGIDPLILFNGIVDSNLYLEVLKKPVKPLIRNYGNSHLGPFVFNAPIQRTKLIQDWRETNSMEIQFWPPNSPDLNPIENIWAF